MKTKAKPTTQITKHPFDEADTRDFRGTPDCRRCPLPAGHDVHQMPATSPEARAYDAAVLGEHDGDD